MRQAAGGKEEEAVRREDGRYVGLGNKGDEKKELSDWKMREKLRVLREAKGRRLKDDVPDWG